MHKILATMVAVSGALIVPLAFMPWLYVHGRSRGTYYDYSIDGIHVEGLTSTGDGRFIAILGALGALAAALYLIVSNRRWIIGSVITSSGVLIAGASIYDVFLVRRGSKYFPEFLLGDQIFDVNAGVALWLTVVLGVLISVIGLALVALATPTRRLVSSTAAP